MEDEFKYKIVSSARKRTPLPEKEALLVLARKKRARETHTPPVKESLQKAIEWQTLLYSGEVTTRNEIARRERISAARVTQIMSLLHLVPEIQEYILAMPETTHCPVVSIRSLRAITKIENHREQKKAFAALLDIEVRSEKG